MSLSVCFMFAVLLVPNEKQSLSRLGSNVPTCVLPVAFPDALLCDVSVWMLLLYTSVVHTESRTVSLPAESRPVSLIPGLSLSTGLSLSQLVTRETGSDTHHDTDRDL